MKKQKFFNFNFNNLNNDLNFYVNSTNYSAYNGVLDDKNNYTYLKGPKKSGKSFLGSIWLKKYNAIIYKKNFKQVIKTYSNVLIDDFNNRFDNEEMFHILNHCKLNNLKTLIISTKNINELKIKLPDLSSRLKSFLLFTINRPDDDMLLKILTKLFIERQFIIKSHELFEYIIKRADRSYEDIQIIVEKLDNLSLEKKRQLTIPLIKEIL